MDFEGDYTIQVASNQRHSTNMDKACSDAMLNITREYTSVFQLKHKWEKDTPTLNLAPDFQRKLVWNNKQKSELVESVLLGIPLPLIYVKEDEDGVYMIVDGKQRLNALFGFINNTFPLKHLTILNDKNDKYFKELTPLEQNKIEDYSLTLYVIKAPTSDRITFDLFDRVNRGGTRLNNQEMRNALYQGNATRLINRLAEASSFIQATENSIPSRQMKDRYIVLRFIAFFLWQKQITIDPDSNSNLEYMRNIEDFLGKTLRYLNRLGEDDPIFDYLENKFTHAMSLALLIQDKGGFRLPSKSGRKRPVNMAFFESFSYLLSHLHGSQKELSGIIKKAYSSLLHDRSYLDSLTRSIDSRNQTMMRYDIINQTINDLNLC